MHPRTGRGQRWHVPAYRRGVQKRRPNPLQWVWYALGGGLPRELSPWVLADTTGRTWILRHLARAVVQMLPVVALCLLVPVPFAYRISAAAGGLLLGLLFATAFMTETIEHRVAEGRLSARNRRPAPGRARRARPGGAPLPLPPGRLGQLRLSVSDAEADRQPDLEVGDAAVDDLAADLLGLEPLDVPDGLAALVIAVRMASSTLVGLLPTISLNLYTWSLTVLLVVGPPDPGTARPAARRTYPAASRRT